MSHQAKTPIVRRGAIALALSVTSLLICAPLALAAPSATTSPATAVHHRSAVLNGHVDPTGDPGITECHFDWGTDVSYGGGTVPCSQGNAFTSAADVSATLGFLSPDVTYHFRLTVTTTSSGVLHGGDQTVIPIAFPTVHSKLGSFGPDGTAATSFDGNRFGPLAFWQQTRDLFELNANSSTPGGIYGFDASSPLSYPPLSGTNPLPIGEVFNAQMLAVDSTAGSSAGNLYYASEGRNEEQRITVGATAGAFRLCFDPDGGGPEPPQCTTDLAFNASSNSVGNALDALPALDKANFGIVGGPGDANGSQPYRIFFGAEMKNDDVPQITCANGATPLTGGAGCAAITPGQGVPDKVHGFDASGNPLGGNFPIDPNVALPLQGADFGGVAVDSAGHIWITNKATGKVLEYSSSGAFLSSLDVASQFPRKDPKAIAFDSNDDLYVGSYFGSGAPSPDEGVWHYTAASGYAAPTKLYDRSVDALAVDPVNHHVFLSPREAIKDSQGNSAREIREYDLRGNLLSEFARGSNADSAAVEGVAVDGANHYVYAARPAFANGSWTEKIEVFDPGVPVEVPTITKQPASPVSGASATLNAKVDPETQSVNDCHFDWGITISYGNTAPCNVSVGSGSGDVDVSAQLTELNGGTTYHFRIVASSATGTSRGEDQTLTTLGPHLDASSVDFGSISTGGATIKATINPEGEATSFHLDYGTTTSYGSSTAEKALGAADSVDHATTQVLAGLDPATAYHLRVVATNASGTVRGPDLSFGTYPIGGDSFSCANEDMRTGPGARLPDCRAYEQASPVDKNGTDVSGSTTMVTVSESGDAVTFNALASMPGAFGAQNLQTFMSRRGPVNWSTQGLFPSARIADRVMMVGLTPDLADAFSVSRSTTADDPGWALVDRNTASETDTVVHPNLSDISGQDQLAGTSSDHSKVYFVNPRAQVIPDASPGVRNLYLWERDGETISVAGQIPEAPDTECGAGGPACVIPAEGTTTGLNRYSSMGFTQQEHAVSPDGEQVIFSGGPHYQLYARLGAAGSEPSTVQISVSQRSTPDPAGPQQPTFQYASRSGEKVFFTSAEELTEDANTGTADVGVDLYVWDRNSRQLTDITPDEADPNGAEVIGVVGGSEAGDYLYFVANADLDGPGGAVPGTCQKIGFKSINDYAGQCNLYLWHSGDAHPTFLARLDPNSGGPGADMSNVTLASIEICSCSNGTKFPKTGLVSADGRTVLFSSIRQLTSYDNQGKAEFYRWHVGDAAPACVTCNPTGAPPLSSATMISIEPGGVGPVSLIELYPRGFSADGSRVFFQSSDKLVAADTNGDAGCIGIGQGAGACQDVYEWEAPGSGSCSAGSPSFSPPSRGCLYLISTGTGDEPAFLLGASASGDDAFFTTRGSLLPQDSDKLVDAYDASVLGGIPAQHAVRPPGCAGDACRGASSSPPVAAGAATASFQGAGNPPARHGCPKGKVRRHGRCVAGSHRKHRHRKHRAANRNRRGHR